MYREHLPAHLGMSSDMSAICRMRSGETGAKGCSSLFRIAA
jgi:hypothetical protein